MDRTRLRNNTRYDVIVVGSGAGGSAAAYRLVKAGLNVCLVEKGKRLPKDGSTLDVATVIHEGRFKSREPWRDRHGKLFTPEEYFNVGGKTKWYGAALARFSPEEFAAETGHDCLAWPLERRDLEAYYDEIEALLGVGRFECEPDLARIIAQLPAHAWRAEPLPMGLAPDIAEHAEEAAHFDGFASAAGLKADAERALLDRVAAAPNLTVLSGRAVTALRGSLRRIDRVAGVRLDDGTNLDAREVVLAAGALHSPRLLERYVQTAGLDHLPAARHIGRNFKLHLLTAVLAVSPSRKMDLIRKTTLLTHAELPHSSVQPLGFDGELIATLIPRYVPRALARIIGARAYGFFLQTEDGSSPDNRVRGADALCDEPVLDYDARRTPAARAEHRKLVKTFCRDLRRAGFLALSQGIGLHGTAHACGTLVAGVDPARSVVGHDGRVHGIEGLSVADGSVLPRASRVNPALTIYAWSLRVADQIAARIERGAERAPASVATVA